MASSVKAPRPKSSPIIYLEKIMAPMVTGIAKTLIIEMASETEVFNPFMSSAAAILEIIGYNTVVIETTNSP